MRRVVEVAAFALVILNLLDAVFTLVWVETGVAAEGNPLMDQAMAHGPLGFMAVKLALVSLGVLLLWRLRHRRAAATAIVASAIAYSAILVVHLSVVPQLVATLR
jgi:cytochrome bd-type quinol oxidase subunit 2